MSKDAVLTGKSILMVDDSEESRLVVKAYLKEYGVIFEEAGNVKDGIEKCLEVLPHLIILDIKLVDETGIDFLKEKMNHTKLQDIPVIIYSSVTNQKIVASSMALGPCDYILKPITPSKLIYRVRKIFKERETKTWIFDDKNEPILNLRVNAQLTGISESTCQISAPVKIKTDCIIHLDSEILDKIDASYCQLKAIEDGRIINTGEFANKFLLLGVTDKIASKVRAVWNLWKNEK